jgi:protein-S-isoprenylcysteine O-methyltransferase Ste14
MSDRTKSWLFVSVQGVLLAVLIFFTDSAAAPSGVVVVVGRVVELIGAVTLLISFYDLRKSLTALPMPKQNGVLQTHGLYKYVRHPMYVGVLTVSLGIAIASGSLWKYLVVLALYVLFSLKARYEETLLVAKYPGYAAYMQATRRFVPLRIKH